MLFYLNFFLIYSITLKNNKTLVPKYVYNIKDLYKSRNSRSNLITSIAIVRIPEAEQISHLAQSCSHDGFAVELHNGGGGGGVGVGVLGLGPTCPIHWYCRVGNDEGTPPRTEERV